MNTQQPLESGSIRFKAPGTRQCAGQFHPGPSPSALATRDRSELHEIERGVLDVMDDRTELAE